MLRKLKYSVFGLGNTVYGEHYNVVGRALDRAFFKLGAKRFHRYSECDESADIMAVYTRWREHGDPRDLRRLVQAGVLIDPERSDTLQ